MDAGPEAPAEAMQPDVDEPPQGDAGAGQDLDVDGGVVQDVADVEPGGE
jgi:hypothetical protein